MPIERPKVSDPIRLAAHLEDDHDTDPNLAHYMCANSLRDLHKHVHDENIAFTPHFHADSEHSEGE